MAKVYIVFLVLGCTAYADQVNCIKWKDVAGATVGTYCKPFSVRAGTGIQFSDDGLGRITITGTGSGGGIAGPGGSDGQLQINLNGILSGSTGLTWNDSSSTLTATHITGISNRPYIDVVRDCGAVGDGITDDGATINTCLTNSAGKTVFFPKTQAATACDYYSTVTLNPQGNILGAGAWWHNSGAANMEGVHICYPDGVTFLDYELTPCRGSCYLGHIGFINTGNFFGNLQTATKFIVPNAAAMDEWDRDMTSVQRASNVLTVTVKGVNGVGEKLFQQVGSTVAITGVVGDATLNGLCIISALSGASSYGDNYSTFTCPQNGADTATFTNDGTLKLPTTGAAIADGIRVCGNFYVFDHIVVMGADRWGINADANAGEGCTNAFADQVKIRDSAIVNNQVGGFYTRGTDSSVNTLDNNEFYYNGWGAVDGTALGNTYINNNFSNNGALWASQSVPATKNITSVNRTTSTVAVVLASADTNIRLGSCIVIAGVTDASFNNTSGQCYIVTSFTNSTHFSYIQPGNPVDASSSGGTSRYAKFSETYLSTGLDSGSYKMGLGASASSDSLLLNNYIEGGQPCKLGTAVLAIQGANTPCSPGSFTGSFLSTQYFAAGTFSSSLTDLGNKNDGSGYELTFHAGATSSGTSNHEYLTWDTYNNVRAWRLDTKTTGTAGADGFWHLSSDGTTQTRIALFGSNNTGNSYLNGTGTGEVSINKAFAGTAGSGGLCVYNGSSTKGACLTGTGYVATASTVVGSLPTAAAGNAGQMIRVSDSTSVAAEGQTCVGGSNNNALAFSNGSLWKCF